MWWRKFQASPAERAHYLQSKKHDTFKRNVRKMGLSLEEFLAAEELGCLICEKTREEEGRRLSMDHDHQSGKFRGLLCNRCNMVVGLIEHRPELLREVPAYLGWVALVEGSN